MLNVLNLTKRYNQTLANDDLSFQVEAGEIAVLLGPNGAGKSTAIRSIAGLLRFSGQITLDGYPNKSAQARQILGYVPDVPAVYEMLTVYEHLEFIARAYRLAGDWPARAEGLLERFDLGDKRDKLGKELSRGMQQKVSICCALLPQPRVMLWDEPLVGLDPKAIKELKQVLLEMRQAGCAAVVSTHILDSVMDIWDRTIIMQKGRIVAVRTRVEEAEQQESLESLFFRITEGEGSEA